MSKNKLYNTLCGLANWAHRWDKETPTTYIYGTDGTTDTVTTVENVRKLVLGEIAELNGGDWSKPINSDELRQRIEVL